MIKRSAVHATITAALARSRVVALMGPRQSGKTTLARQFVPVNSPNYFDLEDPVSLQRLAEPMTALQALTDIIVIDEIQRMPALFPILRVLADRAPLPARFLILCSASPDLLQQTSESLAGRVERIDISGFSLGEKAWIHTADTGCAAVSRSPSLRPWHENLKKRQVKVPRIYFRDSGLLYQLLGIRSEADLLLHPRLGASWEGYVLEEVLKSNPPDEAWFWATHAGAELDLLMLRRGRRIGVEIKRMDAPKLTRSMRIAFDDLRLEQLVVLYPGSRRYALAEGMEVVPFAEYCDLSGATDAALNSAPTPP